MDLRAQVTENNEQPAAEVEVAFSLLSGATVLLDTAEHIETTRWEGTFRVEDPRIVTGLRLRMQLRGVSDPNSRLSLNRTVLDQIPLPRDPLWRETTFNLPAQNIIGGINHIEIVGARGDQGSDHFSAAGLRGELLGRYPHGVVSTNPQGWAVLRLPADRVARFSTYRAELIEDAGRYDEAVLELTPGEPARILIAPAADTLLAGGVEETEVLALLTDLHGNPIQDRRLVSFRAEPEGQVIPQEARTLGDGSVTVRFLAPTLAENAITRITATWGNHAGVCGVNLSGAEIDLTAAQDRLLANGSAQTTLRAHVHTADGRPVVNRRVQFTATRGTVTPSAVTDQNGFAAGTLTAPNAPDTARVTAALGPQVVDSIRVIFTPLVNAVNMTADRESIKGDGLDSAVVTIAVYNGLDAGAENVRVDLSVNRGRLSARQVVTNRDGLATAKLFSEAMNNDDSIRVTADAPQFGQSDIIYVRLRGITISVAADPDSLPANGAATASVLSHVVETSSGNPVTSGRVRFSTNRGSITANADLDQNGQVRAVYTAPLDMGSAQIRARYGNELSATETITLVDRAAEMELEIVPTSILADGSKSAEVIVRMLDPWGGAAPQERITLNFDGPGIVTPQVGYTNANGELRATAQ
ncbi:MAG: invasin domain 3-containing protein [Calditrichota bacterium]